MNAVSNKQPGRRNLRRDAEQNRCQIVSAARELFSERGIEVPLEDIARHAGVGIATLYRRFPSRESLIEEIFVERLRQSVQAAEEALATDDAWSGFCTYVQRLCQMQAEDRGCRDILMMTFPTARSLEAVRIQGHVLAEQVIERAKQQGTLRQDFAPEDLIFLLLANGTFVVATSGIKKNAWKRYVALLLDGCRAESAHSLPEPPLTKRQMLRAMLRLSPVRGKHNASHHT
ncbi:MAG TPA: helix-turn-helix domain-containing protein [Chloroflexota bacterium]